MALSQHYDAHPAPLPRHGSPSDRGSADAYYWREAHPHWYPEGGMRGERVSAPDMTADQIDEYLEAFDNETDRKDYL